ncbi:protein NATD1-like [Antedon mediterranea]|uniref:protein NATD1-like n=1 Tax=Antedon mediterranea TaxID=105859 RepID=UPI003AF56C2E
MMSTRPSASSTSDKTCSSELGLAVVHNSDKCEFTLVLDNTGSNVQPAVLQYEILPGIVDLYHTGVPEAYRGRGVAKHLAKAALEHFSNQDDSLIRLSCTYLQKYVRDHPLDKYTPKLEQNY